MQNNFTSPQTPLHPFPDGEGQGRGEPSGKITGIIKVAIGITPFRIVMSMDNISVSFYDHTADGLIHFKGDDVVTGKI